MSFASRGSAPREGLECLLVKMGRIGRWWTPAVDRRQESLGTPIPRMPTIAPGPRAWLHQRPGTTHLHRQILKTLSRAKPHETDGTRRPQGQPH